MEKEAIKEARAELLTLDPIPKGALDEKYV